MDLMELLGNVTDAGTLSNWILNGGRWLKSTIRRKKEMPPNAAAEEFSRPTPQTNNRISPEMADQLTSEFCTEIDKIDGLDRVGIRKTKFKIWMAAYRDREISSREFTDEIDRLTT